MRVIAGTAKGRRLEAVPGDGTRPITDRAKESLFAILQGEVPGSRVLDLFAGTGAVGIEALSRGAAESVFVESGSKAVATIRRNLATTGFSTQARVIRDDVFRFLARHQSEEFEIVYVAPPQYQGLWRRTLDMLNENPAWVAPGGVVVAQIHPVEEKPEPPQLAQWAVDDRRRYGSVLLLFYRRREAPAQ